MAINQNHLFEDLDGVKCAVVEKNVNQDRVNFLKELLTFNKYQVVVVPSAPPKVAAAPAPSTPDAAATPALEAPPPPPPTSFTVGVTDVRFNATNAIFGRLLHTPDGHVVTLAYWQQKEKVSSDTKPYFD